LHDIKNLDSRGIPGAYVASSAFVTAADTQGEALGFHPKRVFVPHPIQDRTDEEVRAVTTTPSGRTVRCDTVRQPLKRRHPRRT